MSNHRTNETPVYSLCAYKSSASVARAALKGKFSFMKVTGTYFELFISLIMIESFLLIVKDFLISMVYVIKIHNIWKTSAQELIN